MAKLYEMCNDINSEDLLLDKEEMTTEEKEALLGSVKLQIAEEIESNKSRKKNRKALMIAGWAAAAAAVAILVLPNTSPKIAYAMSQVPVLRNVIDVVVIRDYSYAEGTYEADIEQGNVVVVTEDDVDIAIAVDDVTDETEVSVAIINTDIDTMTQELIDAFEADVETGDGYHGVYMSHEVVTDTAEWFTLRIYAEDVEASGVQYVYYYHIDKTTGEIATLADLFTDNADYITPISENIISQMREQMATDENMIYWLDEEIDPEMNFTKIKADQNFYLNEQGAIVICFDEYEVAPGYMGLVEFTVDMNVLTDIIK